MIYSIYHEDYLTDKNADEVIFNVTIHTDIFELNKNIKEQLADKRIVFYIKDFSDNLKDEKWSDLFVIQKDLLENSITPVICLDLIPYNITVSKQLLDLGVPFFFQFICNTKMQLMRMFDLGVSDIYIGGELGFSLKDVQLIKNKRFINIRVMPDHPKNFELEQLVDPLKTFWIIPQSLDIYAPYVDVFEFRTRAKAKLKIYKEKKWEGKVSTLIPDSKCEVFCDTLPPSFGICRLNCGLHCAYSSCHACEAAVDFAKQLTKFDLMIRKDDEKND